MMLVCGINNVRTSRRNKCMGIAKRRQTQWVLNCSCKMRPAVNVYVCMYGPDHVNEFADGGDAGVG